MERACESGTAESCAASFSSLCVDRSEVCANCERAIERQHSWSWQQSFGAWSWSDDAGSAFSGVEAL